MHAFKMIRRFAVHIYQAMNWTTFYLLCTNLSQRQVRRHQFAEQRSSKLVTSSPAFSRNWHQIEFGSAPSSIAAKPCWILSAKLVPAEPLWATGMQCYGVAEQFFS